MYELMTKSELFCEVLNRCYNISKRSKADVFFQYSPHCDAYSICYYADGWSYDAAADMEYMDSVVVINRENLINTLAKLTALATRMGVL